MSLRWLQLRAPHPAASGVALALWKRLPWRARLLIEPLVFRLVPARPFAPATGGTPFVASSVGGELPSLHTRVSVVIPTRDAGPGFSRTLEAIARQRGLAEIELIVVDSGSRDGTQERARAYDARLVEIPSAEFSHGGTRQLGAELATGDVLLMTVQDAVLVGPYALRRLCLDLQSEERCAAVSARQVPHSASDLFAAYGVWAHTRAMTEARATRSFAGRSHVRRARAQMDDVCALIKREAWLQVGFRPVPFAEDLDFGLRALESGWTIGTSSAAVAHAHVRSAEYHLKRMIADRVRLGAMLELDRSPFPDETPARLAAAAISLLGELEAAFTRASDDGEGVELAPWLTSVAAALRGELDPAVPGPLLSPLAALLDPVAAEASATGSKRGVQRELAVQLQRGLPQEFAHAFHAVPREAATEFVAKLAATIIGAALGDAILRQGSTPPEAAKRLLEGV